MLCENFYEYWPNLEPEEATTWRPISRHQTFAVRCSSDGPHAAMKNQEGGDTKITAEPHAPRAIPSRPVAAPLLRWERSEPLRHLRMSRGPAEANVEGVTKSSVLLSE